MPPRWEMDPDLMRPEWRDLWSAYRCFGCWPFWDGAPATPAGALIRDYSPQRNHGTIVDTGGNLSWNQTLDRRVMIDMANPGSPAASDSRVDLNSLSVPANTYRLTIVVYMRHVAIDGTIAERYISQANDWNTADHYYMFGQTETDKIRSRLKIGGTTDTVLSSAGVLANNAWRFLVCRYDGALTKLYSGGTEVASAAPTNAGSTLDVGSSIATALLNQGAGPSSHWQPIRGQCCFVAIFADAVPLGLLRLWAEAPLDPFQRAKNTIWFPAGLASTSTTHDLAASIDGDGAIGTAELTAAYEIAGTIAGTGDIGTASLDVTHQLAASISATGDISTAELLAVYALGASVDAAGDITADLTEITATHQLEASIDATSAATADLDATYDLAGTVAGVGAVTADLTAIYELTATIEGSSGATSDLSLEAQAAAGFGGASGMTADLTITAALAASVDGTGDITADLSTSEETHQLGASVDASSGSSADIDITATLASMMDGTSGGSASLSPTRGLATTCAAVGSMSASLTVATTFVTGTPTSWRIPRSVRTWTLSP